MRALKTLERRLISQWEHVVHKRRGEIKK